MPATSLDVAVPQATVATFSSTANSDTASVVSPLPSILDNEWKLNPTLPKFLTRYDRKFTIERWSETPRYIVQPLQTSHESSGPLPPGWKECIHFEGQCFFYHEQKRVLTESWLYDEEEVEKIDHCLAVFEALEQTYSNPVPPQSQLVLEIQSHPDYGWTCWYYYAEPKHRSIFWFHDVNMAEYLNEVKGGDIRKHTKNFLQAEYWRHFEYFHEAQTVGKDVLDELSTIIRYAHTDAKTSTESTVSQSTEDLERLQKEVDDAKGSLDEGGDGFPWIIGRAMYYICQDRYLNYYGQRGARLSRMHSVHKPPEKEKRSLRFQILSSLLFKGPETHLLEFERIFIDEMVMREPWIQLVKKRMSDWVEHSTFGTILLTANVAFLAIPSIDNGNNPPHYRSPAQIASYLSVIFSIGGVILGLVLLRLHRTMERANVNDACKFLKSRCHRERGLEALSVMYSLPYALLMWAMISFMFAFLWMCFISKSVPALIFVISSSVFVVVLIVWCINLVWINDPERWVHVEQSGNRFALKSMAKLTRHFRLRKTREPDVELQIPTPPVVSEEKQKEQ